MDDFKVTEPEEFMFVWQNNGWWWKVTNMNDLVWYHIKDTKYDQAIGYYLHHKDDLYKAFGPESFDKDPEEIRIARFTFAIEQFAIESGCSFLDACKGWRMKIAAEQMQNIHSNGYILMNSAGGYNSGPYEQWVRRKKFMFPDYKKSDIKISRFEGGQHYYVRIGDLEVRENNQIKWNTKEEALMVAERYVEVANDDS